MLDFKVFPQKSSANEDEIDDAAVLYCERFMEFLIDLLSQLPTRRYIHLSLPLSLSLFHFHIALFSSSSFLIITGRFLYSSCLEFF